MIRDVNLHDSTSFIFKGENMTKISNLYQKINTVRKEFKDSDIKKSGENKFQNFKYFELSDIVPIAIELCNKHNLYTHIDIGTPLYPNFASLYVIDIDNPNVDNNKVIYRLKLPSINDEGAFNSKIQDTGKMETYVRRYLYMLFLDIAIPDEVDGVDNRPKKSKSKRR